MTKTTEITATLKFGATYHLLFAGMTFEKDVPVKVPPAIADYLRANAIDDTTGWDDPSNPATAHPVKRQKFVFEPA